MCRESWLYAGMARQAVGCNVGWQGAAELMQKSQKKWQIVLKGWQAVFMRLAGRFCPARRMGAGCGVLLCTPPCLPQCGYFNADLI
jgi:hypothetical protein